MINPYGTIASDYRPIPTKSKRITQAKITQQIAIRSFKVPIVSQSKRFASQMKSTSFDEYGVQALPKEARKQPNTLKNRQVSETPNDRNRSISIPKMKGAARSLLPLLNNNAKLKSVAVSQTIANGRLKATLKGVEPLPYMYSVASKIKPYQNTMQRRFNMTPQPISSPKKERFASLQNRRKQSHVLQAYRPEKQTIIITQTPTKEDLVRVHRPETRKPVKDLVSKFETLDQDTVQMKTPAFSPK